MLKLKLKAKPATGEAPAASEPTASTASATPAPPKIKLKFGSQSAASSTAQPADTAPKTKRPYNRKPKFDEHGNPIQPAPKGPLKQKKRPRDSESTSPVAKRKIKLKSQAHVTEEDDTLGAPLAASSGPKKIVLKPKPVGATMIKLKHQGKPPYRPPGVGYDSEADDAEKDPAIETQFVLRMVPGPDCDAIRKAIENKTIGKTQANGGPGVGFRFIDRQGRRTVVSVNGRKYAATMVDLPCVIESMKSWNKKDWVKTADISQMLLVLGRVKDEEEAKKYPLPREVDASTHQYPHGLTPPMHWVRKRRFRPRASYKDIEEVERTVEQLMEQDMRVKEQGGSTEYEFLDEDELDNTSGEESSNEDQEMPDAPQYGGDVDAEGEIDDEIDEDEMAKAMEAEFLAAAAEDEDLFGDNRDGDGDQTGAAPSPSAHDVAMHALGDAAPLPTTEGQTPGGSPSAAETESADDDDDEDGESEEEIDEDKLAAQQELQQQREEIADLENELQAAWAQYKTMSNVLFKQRIMAKIEGLENNLNMKRAAIGEEV
ncbi:hypothetical protein GQ43DRAFT_440293, partial [Delitschia confertaspora ATCC 74209]